MWVKAFSWSGVIACSSLYGLLFLALRYLIAIGGMNHVQFGLLLFMIPGALAALMSRDAPFTVLLLAMLLASPPCLALMQLSTFHSVGLGQEIAIIASAVFWCGSGALVVMLWRTLMEIHQRQSGKRG
ncbi:inner membrane protein YbjM [Erwinia sp. JUb26]|uniref:inner membrane protein YbjM n=1 Tax=Erwinia sp. JUb26 TaxID=2485126 RepID=UPI000F4735E8|nr:inner membrane protein YbjM [Erwinia sp. JUb26]ROR11213.1 putative inner membrane protein YbjM [Erwinia sp. JUb26]